MIGRVVEFDDKGLFSLLVPLVSSGLGMLTHESLLDGWSQQSVPDHVEEFVWVDAE